MMIIDDKRNDRWCFKVYFKTEERIYNKQLMDDLPLSVAVENTIMYPQCEEDRDIFYKLLF